MSDELGVPRDPLHVGLVIITHRYRALVPRPEPISARATVFDAAVVAESDHPDGSRETVVGRKGRRETSRSGTDGSNTQEYEGRPTQNEENVLDALHRIADKWNADAGDRLWREHVCTPSRSSRDCNHDDSVDGALESAQGVRLCQVVRVEQGTLPDRGATSHARSAHDDDSLARYIVAAAEPKMIYADPKMILVLDANDAPAYTDDLAVAQIAGDRLVTAGHDGKWREVWLVGPTGPRTIRIL